APLLRGSAPRLPRRPLRRARPPSRRSRSRSTSMITRSDRLLRRVLAPLLLTAAVVGAPSRVFADDPRAAVGLEAKRERFRAGMDKYKDGAFAEAIEIWEAIYAELGAETGYRLAFNIGRAYEQLAATRTNRAAAVADTAKAARHYAAYVNEVVRRREA